MEPLLPPHPNTHRFGGGRPWVSDRVCADAIFFVLRTGCQWNALNATGLCASSTAHDRFQEWVGDGFFLRFWQADLAKHDALAGIDWRRLSLDGALTKAPLAGEKTGPNPTDRGKRGAKRSLLVDGGGVPVDPCVAGANANNFKLFVGTILSISVARPAAAKRRPQHLCLDKGYDCEEVRALAAARGFTLHLRSRGEERQARRKGSRRKARRWAVERTHSWFNRYRSLLVRWAKKEANYLGLLHFAAALITYQATGLFG